MSKIRIIKRQEAFNPNATTYTIVKDGENIINFKKLKTAKQYAKMWNECDRICKEENKNEND